MKRLYFHRRNQWHLAVQNSVDPGQRDEQYWLDLGLPWNDRTEQDVVLGEHWWWMLR